MLLLVALVQINLYIQLASATTNVFRPRTQHAATSGLSGRLKLPRQSPRTSSPTLIGIDSASGRQFKNDAETSALPQQARENKLDDVFNSHLSSNQSSSDSGATRVDYTMTIANSDEDDFHQNGIVEGAETFTNNHQNSWLPGDQANNNNQEKQHNSRHYNKYQLVNAGALNNHYNHHAANKYSSPSVGQYSSNSFANNFNYNYIQNLLSKPTSHMNGNHNFANSFGHSNSLLLNAHPPSGLAPLATGASPPQQQQQQQQHSYASNGGFLSPYISASSALLSAAFNTGNNQQAAHQPAQPLTYSPVISAAHQDQQQQQQQASNFTTIGELPGSSTCGRQQVAGYREPRIVGGNSTYEGEFPWAVSIQRHGNHHCGGVIVGRRWILTAAHCVRSQLVGNLLVRTGGSTLSRSANSLNSHLEHDYLVEQIVMHDDFSRYDNLTASQSKSSANTNNADIALLKLKHEILLNEFAWPVCFPNREAGNFSGHEATVIGWGKLNEKSEDFSNDLQKVKLTIIDNKLCQNWFRQAGREMPIDERIICAGFKSGGKDACHGDSGGPLLSRINGQYVVVGVVSTGIGCARPLLPGLYSRVSSYIGWIEKHVV